MENTKSPSKKGELHVYILSFSRISSQYYHVSAVRKYGVIISVIIVIFHEVLLSRNQIDQIVLVLELCRTGQSICQEGELGSLTHVYNTTCSWIRSS